MVTYIEKRPGINIVEENVGKKDIAISSSLYPFNLQPRQRVSRLTIEIIMNMELCSTLATVIVVMLYISSCTSPASAVCTHVADTTDRCRNANLLVNQKWYSKGSYGQIDLPHPNKEIYWYCGSSRERTGWGEMANRLIFSFKTDGTIYWWIYKCRSCTTVDTTYDRCRSASYIHLPITNQNIYKNAFKQVVKLPGLMNSLQWWCGHDDERTAWDEPANELSVRFFSDGKIEWEVKRCN